MANIVDKHGNLSEGMKKLCEDKINGALFILSSASDFNGNPFLYTFAAGKRHNLTKEKTASTDGSSINWGAEWLLSLTNLQVLVVLKHEILHGLLMHVVQMKRVRYPRLLNMMADFIVNSIIDNELKSSDSAKFNPWKDSLGEPITLSEIKELYALEVNFVKDNFETLLKISKLKHTISSSQSPNEKDLEELKSLEEDLKNKSNKNNKRYCLLDKSCLSKTVMQLYNENVDWYEKLGNQYHDMIAEFSFDDHIPSDMTESDIFSDILKAIEANKSMRGSIPGDIQRFIDEFSDPTLDLFDFVSNTISKHKIKNGKISDYAYFKRRFLSQDMYNPRKVTVKSNILVLIDTSGSMSVETDIKNGLSEITQFVNASNIYTMAIDAEPYWDTITKVEKFSDFSKIKLKGGGGTVFLQFFEQYSEKLKRYGPFTSIIVITDGFIDDIPPSLSPPCQVGWIITSGANFNPPFGKPVYLSSGNRW